MTIFGSSQEHLPQPLCHGLQTPPVSPAHPRAGRATLCAPVTPWVSPPWVTLALAPRGPPGTGGGVWDPPEQGAAPPLPESPAGCGCERQVRAGEGCLEFVSRSRERQEQILIINNPAGWRLRRCREGWGGAGIAPWQSGYRGGEQAGQQQCGTLVTLVARLCSPGATGEGILLSGGTLQGAVRTLLGAQASLPAASPPF